MTSVLVVDDDPVTRAVLRVMLEREGAHVDEANSVETASAYLEDNDVDLVICDYVLPGANGLDLLEAHRALADRFVLLTGTRERSDLDDSRVDWVSAYLTKPVGSEELGELLSVHAEQNVAG